MIVWFSRDYRHREKTWTAPDTDRDSCGGRKGEEKGQGFHEGPARSSEMVAVVAREGRRLQRYAGKGRRSVAPQPEKGDGAEEKRSEKCSEKEGSVESNGETLRVARQGRELQRYTSNGRRLVVGCIPYKFKADKSLEVLVISSQKGQAILFPKGGWESDESQKEAVLREAMEEAGVQGTVESLLGKWRYKSKTQDQYKLGFMFPLNVKEELLQWPEMETRKRKWVSVGEVREKCNETWMKEALEKLVKRLKERRERSPAFSPELRSEKGIGPSPALAS